MSFLVMEYVEGTPLAGPLPLDRALLYAGQIAAALDEAHRKQIVHRDLKPSNVLVTKSGVKLLDFGLAKFGSKDAPLDEALTRGVTAAGTILGTLHYMSPEQLQGVVADARSDIFAFGLVLYEMLTGKRAFDGASAASVIAAILERPAPSVAAVAPASLDRLVQRCLAKDPEERWQSARDISAALDLIAEPSIAVATSMTSQRPRVRWPWLLAAALAVGLAAVSFIHFRERQPAPSLMRFQIPVPEGARITTPVLSPNGLSIAFVAASRTGASQIWVRPLDALESRPLPGTEQAGGMIFWSADSRSIAFVADDRLKTIETSGREVRTLTDVPGAIAGGSWNAEGVIIVSRFRGGLLRISAAGGSLAQLTALSGNEVLHLAPAFLPDGRHYVYVVVTRDGAVARLATLDGSESREFPIERGSGVVYVPARTELGYFLFARGATLFAQPVDSRSFSAAGETLVVADDLSVAIAPGGSPTIFSVSSTNTLAYLAGDIFHPTQVTWFDRAGKEQSVVGTAAVYNDVALSPDDTRVALTKRDGGNDDIWIVDLARNVPTRFTFDSAQDWHPVWSPDGRRLAFSSTRLLGGTINCVFWKETIVVKAAMTSGSRHSIRVASPTTARCCRT
jgi:hypothetical protein